MDRGQLRHRRLFYWDGQPGTTVDAPGGYQLSGLNDIHGTAPDDIWVVGDGVHRWDGVQWTSERLNNWGLNDIRGTAPDVWAVGGLRAGPGVIFITTA